MPMPLDSSGSLTMRAAVEATAARSEPVVEFARKKSPIPASEVFDEQLSSRGTTECEFAPAEVADLPQVSVPRDRSNPLVTGDDRHAREALESYKSLRTRLLSSQAKQGFRSIAITSVGRSEGKTLTAFNLAYCCAHVENLSVLLIDGDLRNRSLTTLFGRLPSVGLADVMSGRASCEEALVRTDVPNLCVMGAGTNDSASTELFSTGKWSQLIRWSRHHFKIVLIDALSMGAFADFELMAQECDGILVVVRARSTHREALRMAIEQLDAGKLVGVVWNGSDSERGNRFRS
jgi:capsular exopolysaccharide synthesis family protein